MVPSALLSLIPLRHRRSHQPRGYLRRHYLLRGGARRARFGLCSLWKGEQFSVLEGSSALTSPQFENFSTWNGGMSFLLAFTAPMWSLTGYDAAVHVSEECTNASTVAPLAILVGVSSTWLLGFFVLISASFAIADVGALVDSDLAMPMAQVSQTGRVKTRSDFAEVGC